MKLATMQFTSFLKNTTVDPNTTPELGSEIFQKYQSPKFNRPKLKNTVLKMCIPILNAVI